MTEESKELALYAINCSENYGKRCNIARMASHEQTYQWQAYAITIARRYVREFGTTNDRWDTVFTVEDVLATAAELADYYARHVAEMDNNPDVPNKRHLKTA